MGWLLNSIPRWLAGQVAAALNRLWALLSGTVLWVPDVTGLPQVQRLTAATLAVVDAGFVLMIIAAGVTLMTRETLQVRYGIGELVPRLVIAFVAANLAGPIVRGLTGGANALTAGLTGQGIAQSAAFGQLARTVAASLVDPSAALLVAVLGAIVAVLLGMLIVLWIVRLAVLVCLAGIAPLALACHASPYTDPAATLPRHDRGATGTSTPCHIGVIVTHEINSTLTARSAAGRLRRAAPDGHASCSTPPP